MRVITTGRRCDHCACPIPSGIEYLVITGSLDVVVDHPLGTLVERSNTLGHGAEVCGTTCLLALVSSAKDMAQVVATVRGASR